MLSDEATESAVGEVEPVMVIMRFRTDRTEDLASILANYVVLTRTAAGARNLDLVASTTTPGLLIVIEKWDSAETQRTHFDSAEMVDMATACTGLLTQPPDIDLFEGISMHDLA